MSLNRGHYLKFPDTIKNEIANSKNPYLFPELKIPRTTALYWITHRKKYCDIDVNNSYKEKIKQLNLEIEKEKSLRQLLQVVRSLFPFEFSNTRLKSKIKKQKILQAIQVTLNYHKLHLCLNAIGMKKSMYFRWKSQFFSCTTGGLCKKRKPNQLTDYETLKMKHYVTGKKHSHLSLRSLCLLAQREGEVFASIDTWRKYTHLYGWKRQRKAFPKKKYNIGVRANTANEIWHIDVTEIQLDNGSKVYLQAIIDNYSRYILAWKLSLNISAKNTKKLIRLAFLRAKRIFNISPSKLITDGGKENINHLVTQFITSKNIKRLIARVEIRKSNSIIEAFFRSLKNNYIYHQSLSNLKTLKRKVNFYLKQHNEVIPHSAFNGATPQETYLSLWTEEKNLYLQSQKTMALENRKLKNKMKLCERCS